MDIDFELLVNQKKIKKKDNLDNNDKLTFKILDLINSTNIKKINKNECINNFNIQIDKINKNKEIDVISLIDNFVDLIKIIESHKINNFNIQSFSDNLVLKLIDGIFDRKTENTKSIKILDKVNRVSNNSEFKIQKKL